MEQMTSPTPDSEDPCPGVSMDWREKVTVTGVGDLGSNGTLRGDVRKDVCFSGGGSSKQLSLAQVEFSSSSNSSLIVDGEPEAEVTSPRCDDEEIVRGRCERPLFTAFLSKLKVELFVSAIGYVFSLL